MARYRAVSLNLLALDVLLLAMSAIGVAIQPTIVFTRQDVPSYAGARSVVAGDFDRDGWIDVAHANAGRNSVTVLLSQAQGASNFVRTYDVPVGLGPFDMTTGDFNQDGVLDLAVTHGSASTISVLLGQEAGGFTRSDLQVPAGPRGIAAADINKDGRLDLIVTGWDANAVRVLLGTGSGGFVNGALVSSIASHPQGVAVSDFNRDGHLDLAAAHESGNGLVILTGHAGTSFQARSISGMANLNVLTIGDFNRDGWSDVAAASSSGNRVGVYLGGTSGPQLHRTYPTGAAPRGITARDINVDGLLDLITANRDGDNVSVLLGDTAAPGTFAPAESFPAGGGSRAIVSEDFDWDGRIDLATGNQDAATTSVLWNETPFDRAAFSFSRLSFGAPTNEIGRSLAVPADFNEDGKLDVVVKPDFRVGAVVQVLLTDGPVVTLPFHQYFGGYLVDDFNRDGHMDVILMEDGPSLILLPFLGNGRGAFTGAPETTIAAHNFGTAVGDLNADAAPDIVFISHDPAIGSYFLQILVGRGDGTFTAGTRVNTSDFTSAATVVDHNRDGKMDVVVFVRGTLTVFRGDGAGQLTLDSATRFSDAYIQVLALADLNHDGFLDAVAGEQGRVSVSLGRDVGFAEPSVIVVERFSNWSSLVIADINLDGQPDIIGGAGFIMRGRGDGTFEPLERFDWDAPYIHVVDFTRDGLLDIVMPVADAAFDVIVNRRNSVNHAPTVTAGPDQTFEYADQFGDLPPTIVAVGTDADIHELSYEWRDESGAIVVLGRWLNIEGRSHGTYTFTVTVRDGRGGTATDSVNVTIVPTTEVVLWSASGFYGGTFSQVPDSTAAGGERGYDSNLGRAKVPAPVPFSANRIILGFVADPTQTYKLWLRLKADGNHWSNDSVWVQFTGSTDVQGNAIYRVGTTSGLAVNLEECLGCGVSGWGWADDGWGAPNLNGVMLRFPTGGHQSIVIQTREDGVSIDQLVLSSSTYATTRPGPAKNDATILPATFWQEQ
jgi:hypothetical protein